MALSSSFCLQPKFQTVGYGSRCPHTRSQATRPVWSPVSFPNCFSSHQSLFCSQKMLFSWSWVSWCYFLFLECLLLWLQLATSYWYLIFKANQVSSPPSFAPSFNFSPSHSLCCPALFLLQFPGEQLLTLHESLCLSSETPRHPRGRDSGTWPRHPQTHRRKQRSRTTHSSSCRELSSAGPPPAEWQTGLSLLPPLKVWGPREEMRCWERSHPSSWWMVVSSWPVREHLLAWGSYLERWIVWLIVWSFWSLDTGCQIYWKWGKKPSGSWPDGHTPGQRTERLHE